MNKDVAKSRLSMREPRNRIFPHKVDPRPPTIRKVAADSVPYGENISRHGRTVWAAYDGEALVVVASTAGEARTKYREARQARQRQAARDKERAR